MNEHIELSKILKSGKCRICKYVREYDWTDFGTCAAPCESCGAESYDIVEVK